jgi:hypothetical protein
MTKGERTDLGALIRRREKLAKTAAADRAAELLADLERQLAAIYTYDQDETWAAANAVAEQAIEQANLAVAARCAELGIPKEFAPRLAMGWRGRGENASKERPAELRRVGVTRISALEKSARTQIELRSLKLQEEIITGGFTSEAALSFLDKMPAPESLMPVLDARLLLDTVLK